VHVAGADERFEQLVAEGAAEPTEGWDFSWFSGRATEERPSWGYARLLVERVRRAASVLDVETGGGEVFAEVLERAGAPGLVAATESWPPNLALARAALTPFGGSVAQVADDGALPYGDHTFELVASRHPNVVVWPEIARVLRPGGTYLSQQIGAGTNRELTDFLMGPQPVSTRRTPERAAADATAAGLRVLDVRPETLEVRFFDIGAVVYFLRKVIWTVPGFTVERYRDRLRSLHDEIERNGVFVSHAERFLFEAVKPTD
jgi:SAM-dependent methyltransferase